MSNSYISVFEKDSTEYRALSNVAENLNKIAGRFNFIFYVADIYFDYRQGWKWTTIICVSPEGDGCQILTPKDQEAILTNNAEEIEKMYTRIIGFLTRSIETSMTITKNWEVTNK